MARLDEIGQGIATVLSSASLPEPLFVDLRGQTPVEVLVLFRSVVDACHRCAGPLSLVRISDGLGSRIADSLPEGLVYEGVQIEFDSTLGERIEFYRFPKIL